MLSLLIGAENRLIRTRFMLLITGVIFAVVGVIYGYLDIITTGKGFDSLGLQLVWGEQLVGGISLEGLILGVFLSSAQVYVIFKMVLAVIGSTERVNYMVAWAVLALIDTITDAYYRSNQFNQTMPENAAIFTISVIIYTFGSEWALSNGIAEVVENIGAAKAFIREIFADAREKANLTPQITVDDFLRRRSNGGGGKNEGGRSPYPPGMPISPPMGAPPPIHKSQGQQGKKGNGPPQTVGQAHIMPSAEFLAKYHMTMEQAMKLPLNDYRNMVKKMSGGYGH